MSLRVELTTEGGFADLPGLAAPLCLDGAALPAAQRERLGELVENSLNERPKRASPAVRDARSYRIAIERDGERHAIEASDAAMSAACAALIEFVKAHGRRG